jgi:hypothetical protein
MLTKVKELSGHTTIFDIPFVAAVAASIACRCRGLSLSIEELRPSVKTQIVSTETILQHHSKIYEDHAMMMELSSDIQNLKEWAILCRDVVSLGQMMSWLKIQRVLCVRLFIHDSSLLQLFAYICERTRLNGEPLHTALEELFNDQRTSGFFFLDGRPKNLGDCEKGVKRWSDPKGMLDNLELTKHIFSKRCKPTVAQQIFEGEGRMKNTMVKQLNGKLLEHYLNWELDPPDPIRLEAILISAASSIIGKDSTKSKSNGEVWFLLRKKVLFRPEMEKQLLSKFLDEYILSNLASVVF